MFNRNIGTADRTLRLVIGVAALSLVFVGPRTPWGWIGIIPIATALITWCPLYQLFGLRTCGRNACKR